jgi:DeoR/GlpR family transcriptional regulator of sugar metabolism
MDQTERRMELYRILQNEGVVALARLAEHFGVSTMTVRRDMRHFERQGLASISRGNARLSRGTSLAEPSFATKATAMTAHKQAVARMAADLVADGDAIIVDCGTTTLQLLRYLGSKHVTVITNSMPVAAVAGPDPHIELVLAPGEYDDTNSGVFGEYTIEFLRRFHVDKAFLGAWGWDARAGATDPSLADASVKMVMAASASMRFLLADSSKYGHAYLARYAHLEDFGVIVTDSDLEGDARAAVRFRCPNLMVAPIERG